MQGWARKAVQCGYHLVPAPMDAFNQCPHFNNPLSCPRFIKLDLQCLQSGGGQRLFQGFDSWSHTRRVHLLQEVILKRYFVESSSPRTFEQFWYSLIPLLLSWNRIISVYQNIGYLNKVFAANVFWVSLIHGYYKSMWCCREAGTLLYCIVISFNTKQHLLFKHCIKKNIILNI